MDFEAFNDPPSTRKDPLFGPQDPTLQRLLRDLDCGPARQTATTTKPQDILVKGCQAPISAVPSVSSAEAMPPKGLQALVPRVPGVPGLVPPLGRGPRWYPLP